MTPWDSQHSHIWAKLDHSSTMLLFEDSSPNVVLTASLATTVSDKCCRLVPFVWAMLCCDTSYQPLVNNSRTLHSTGPQSMKSWLVHDGILVSWSMVWVEGWSSSNGQRIDENPRNGSFSPGKQFSVCTSSNNFLLQAESKSRWWFQ